MTEEFSTAEDFSFSSKLNFILSASRENKPPTRTSCSELEGEFSVRNSSAGLGGDFSTEKSLAALDGNLEMLGNSLADMESGSPVGGDGELSMTEGVYENEPENSASNLFLPR